MHRRTPPAASSGRHSPYRPPSPAAALDHLLHTFDLTTVLEAHAASLAAARQNRDLHAVYSALDQLQLSPASATPVHRLQAHWADLELQFHRALNDQGGNLVLSSLAERTLRDGLRACPIVSGEVLSMLHAQHRQILRCVEADTADAAARHTRAHVLYLRDVLLAATHATRPRVRLHT